MSARVSLVRVPAEKFLSLSFTLSVILFTEIFHPEIMQCNIWFIYLIHPWLYSLLVFRSYFRFHIRFPRVLDNRVQTE